MSSFLLLIYKKLLYIRHIISHLSHMLQFNFVRSLIILWFFNVLRLHCICCHTCYCGLLSLYLRWMFPLQTAEWTPKEPRGFANSSRWVPGEAGCCRPDAGAGAGCWGNPARCRNLLHKHQQRSIWPGQLCVRLTNKIFLKMLGLSWLN